MQVRNENASCRTCKHNIPVMPTEQDRKEQQKACKKCTTRNGYSGWEPGHGVAVQETKGWIIASNGKPVETLFRRVI